MSVVRDLVVKLLLSTQSFDDNINRSTQQIRQFQRQAETNIGRVTQGFSALTGLVGKLVPVIGASTGAMAAFQKTMHSTQTTMDAFEYVVESVTGGVDFFFQSLARGDWENFWHGFQESIRLAGDLQKALDELGTQQGRYAAEENEFAYREADIRTRLSKARYEKDAPAVVQLEKELDKLVEERLEAINIHMRDYSMATVARANKDLNRTDVTPERILNLVKQNNREEFKALENRWRDLKNQSEESTGGSMNIVTESYVKGKLTDKAKEALKDMEILEGTDAHIAYLISEQKEDMDKLYKAREQEVALATKALNIEKDKWDIMTRNRRLVKESGGSGSDSASDPKKAALSAIDQKFAVRGEQGMDLQRLATEKKIATIETKLQYTVDPEETIKLTEELAKAKARLQSLEDASKPIMLKAAIAVPQVMELPQTITPPIDKYTQATDMVNKFNEALRQTTFFYGENSTQVTGLTDEINRLIMAYNEANRTNINLLGDNNTTDDITAMSGAIKQLGGTVMGISDNPAIKALGLSIMVLGSMKGIAEAFEANVWYGIAAAAATAASVVTTVSTMKGAKFAGGGIVGDHTIIRANEGEMILNSAQQSRLFSYLSGDNAKGGGTGKVEFVIRGTQLKGVLENYNSKFT